MQHDFILLDRSSSMTALWLEAVSSVNAYVAKLAEEKVDTGVTLATFDTVDGRIAFDIIRDRIVPSTWQAVTDVEIVPRGMTPLNDAVGQIVSLARTGNYDKLAIIIMTDGEENASRELTVKQAKALLDECRARGWQVIFLGANFDNARQANLYGNAAASTISSSVAGVVDSMKVTASKRGLYAATGQSMTYTDEEKAAARK